MKMVIKGLKITNATETVSLESLEMEVTEVKELCEMTKDIINTLVNAETTKEVVKPKASDADLLYDAYSKGNEQILSNGDKVKFISCEKFSHLKDLYINSIQSKFNVKGNMPKSIFDKYDGKEILNSVLNISK